MTAPPYWIAIIACGKDKQDRPTPARELYTGTYFAAARRAAEAIAVRWFILSAKYGLLRPGQVIAPYDMTLDHPGAVTADYVREQAGVYRVLASRVTALCPAAYADLITAAWPPGCVDRPLAGLGIGLQRKKLAELARG